MQSGSRSLTQISHILLLTMIHRAISSHGSLLVHSNLNPILQPAHPFSPLTFRSSGMQNESSIVGARVCVYVSIYAYMWVHRVWNLEKIASECKTSKIDDSSMWNQFRIRHVNLVNSYSMKNRIDIKFGIIIRQRVARWYWNVVKNNFGNFITWR